MEIATLQDFQTDYLSHQFTNRRLPTTCNLLSQTKSICYFKKIENILSAIKILSSFRGSFKNILFWKWQNYSKGKKTQMIVYKTAVKF